MNNNMNNNMNNHIINDKLVFGYCIVAILGGIEILLEV